MASKCFTTDSHGVTREFNQRISVSASIAGHVFCSFLVALVLCKELDQRLATKKHRFEWSDIKQDLRALKQIEIEENGKRVTI
jgi:hypothetical protein